MITKEGHQKVAQTILDGQAAAKAEGQTLIDESPTELARKIYEEHGPFKLKFHTYVPEQEEAKNDWYEGPTEMRSEDEIRERLRRYHEDSMAKEMGGQSSYDKAKELLWVLGYDRQEVDIIEGEYSVIPQGTIDLSEYVELE